MLVGAVLAVLGGCSSTKISEAGQNAPEAVQTVNTPGFRSLSARLDYDESKGLFWSNGWRCIRDDQEFKAGDIVRARENHGLNLVLPNYSKIRLSPGSTLAIEQLERDELTNGPSITRLYLSEGELRLESHLHEFNSVEEVRTAFGVAASIPLERSKRDSNFRVQLPDGLKLSAYEISAEGDVIANGYGPVSYTDADGTTNLTAGAIKQLPLTAELPVKKCSVHGLPMKRKEGRVIYGLLSSGSMNDLRKCPYNDFAIAGCVIHGNSPKTQIMWVCEKCVKRAN